MIIRPAAAWQEHFEILLIRVIALFFNFPGVWFLPERKMILRLGVESLSRDFVINEYQI